jgi:peptide/nickel transport system substrate-binding protein
MPYVSSDRKTYTFRLRSNIRYSNGRPVKASDFRYAIERAFKLRRRTDPRPDYLSAADVFFAIRGADRCHGRRCNLAAGIDADDVDGSITFHLSAPDPYFRYKLTSTWGAAVPAGTPLQEQTRRPLPATGPYRVASVTGDSLRLARNPYFQEWSETAQPEGFPDEIVLKAMSAQRGIALVEQGNADLTSNVALERFSVAPRSRPWKYEHPRAGTVYLVLDPRRPPFDDPRARRALSYAVDRNKVLQLATGELATGGNPSRPTCQLLPPNFPGYRPYCPYTLDPAKAARLVAASGTRRASVSLWVDRKFAGIRVGRYLKLLLKRLGYRPQLHDSFGRTPREYFTQLEEGVMSHRSGPRVAFGAWSADYPAASGFIHELLSCRSKFNYGRFCDRALERRISRAVELEQTDLLGANRLWARLDREITKKALLVPLFNGYVADLVSKRVGNYQYSPWYGALLSQLWVR